MGTRLKHVQAAEEVKVHSIPCKIHANMDKINLENYFRIRKESDTELAASFRGHSLDGTILKLPDGYKGAVFNVSKDETQNSKNYHVVGSFKEMTYWNWNKLPSKADPIINAMDWLNISSAIHDPLE